MIDKIAGVIVVLLLIVAGGYFIWGIGYQGEVYQEVEIETQKKSQGPMVVGIGEVFNVKLPKSSDPLQAWVLLTVPERVQKMDIDRTGNQEVWTFQALRLGNAPLEFSWSFPSRGVWPDDERKLVEIEVR